MDTTLRLDYPGMSTLCTQGLKRKWNADDVTRSGDDISLMLSLGQSQSSSDSSKTSMATGCIVSLSKEATDEGTSSHHSLSFDLNVVYDPCLENQKPTCATAKVSKLCHHHDLKLSLMSGPSTSVITDFSFHQQENLSEASVSADALPAVKEGSISSSWTSTEIPKSFQIDWTNSTAIGSNSTALTHMPPYLSMKSSTTNAFRGTSAKPQRSNGMKCCKFQGCTKGARGASSLCIAHGGGRRCQREGCNKGAEGRTVYCKAHGGGRRCHFLGCTKSAEGRTDYCIAHGGGRRCSHKGCSRAARGKSGLCIRHGGGKRCQKENCTKSAEGYSGFCIAHGGGRRCQFPSCTKGAQGSTFYCKAHGGGKRCTFPGCTKGAEGSTPFCKGHGGGKRCSFQGGGICPKSVHGGTMFCVAHGGGKRCATPGCTRSARGRTNFCVRHGGGKRCKVEGCGKSAQGRTDFCKAHGGGTRCSWGHPDSIHGTGDQPCDRFARGRTGVCTSHSAAVEGRDHGMGSLASSSKNSQLSEPNKEKVVSVDLFTNAGQKGLWDGIGSQLAPQATQTQFDIFTLPEGRVHGGKLMTMLSSIRGLNGGHAGAAPSNLGVAGIGASCMLL